MDPKFSIITSFYGESIEYIDRLYKSICSQKIEWVWVVTDDFSYNVETKQKLLKICEDDPRVIYVEQTEKREMFRDPQKFANGEFVFHIDADDIVHPNYLQHCEFWFHKFPNVKCILSGSFFMDEEGWFDRFFYHKNEKLRIFENFLGRVWRNGYEFNWSEIFSNPRDVIRMNDMFIVKNFEKKGDILCLPRTYIKYEVRKNSNSNVIRDDSDKQKINKCKSEFSNWLSKNAIEWPYESYFFDIERINIPLLSLDWDLQIKRIYITNENIPDYKKRKLRELYQDYELSFGQWEYLQEPDCKVIDLVNSSKKEEPSSKFNIIFISSNDDESYNYYNDILKKNKKSYLWFKQWDYTWILTK
jgi:hypothetical protein